ncbi:MAG: hypothetical protein EOO90_09705 [Pedobacter sp.]|nr:MAG: hypothetical protein EOO90_09705 [Pedobacter sp.]
MKGFLEIARLFSAGEFNKVTDHLSEKVEFHIYEDNKHFIGKDEVLNFCNGITEYFASIDTDFRESGTVVDQHRVVIFGYAEFKRDGVLVNSVNSCDIYEFNGERKIEKIYSYCNSKKL